MRQYKCPSRTPPKGEWVEVRSVIVGVQALHAFQVRDDALRERGSDRFPYGAENGAGHDDRGKFVRLIDAGEQKSADVENHVVDKLPGDRRPYQAHP